MLDDGLLGFIDGQLLVLLVWIISLQELRSSIGVLDGMFLLTSFMLLSVDFLIMKTSSGESLFSSFLREYFIGRDCRKDEWGCVGLVMEEG